MQMEAGTRKQCALVLGGGGPQGIAWEAGMLAGWAEGWAALPGAHPDQPLAPLLAGRIIGTSAGAIVAAHLAVRGAVTALVEQQEHLLKADAPKGPEVARFLQAYFKARLFSRDTAGLRRSMGKSARKLALAGEGDYLAAFRRSYAPDGPWPTHCELLVTGIDAVTGELHIFRADGDTPLAVAVAASCSLPCAFPLVHVGEQAYMDGGIGSPTNTALAAGCDRVLILDALGGAFGSAAVLEKERKVLEAAGSHTLAFMPDAAVAQAIGKSFLDFTRGRRIAALGHAQGLGSAHAVWNFLEGTPMHHSPANTLASLNAPQARA